MWWFYLDMLYHVPGLFLESFTSVEGWVALMIFVAFFWNRELGHRLASWEGISRKWVALPIVLYFFYLLLQANYQKFQMLEAASAEALSDATHKIELSETNAQILKAQIEQLTVENAAIQKGAPILTGKAARVKEIRDMLLEQADRAPTREEFTKERGQEWNDTTSELCGSIALTPDMETGRREITWYQAAYNGTFESLQIGVASVRAEAMNIKESDLED
jgi:hypothetical protein